MKQKRIMDSTMNLIMEKIIWPQPQRILRKEQKSKNVLFFRKFKGKKEIVVSAKESMS